jgi:pimeloyl-ACP methyl ester carboxylesterase
MGIREIWRSVVMAASYVIDWVGDAGPSGASVIALPCSGAGGVMWRDLRAALGGDTRLLTPELYGAANGPVWPGTRAFTLEDEAAPIVQLIDAADGAVHLVGHSYGAAVALQVALARPERVAGLTLYEPAAFQLLQPSDGIEYAEITWLARDVEVSLARGDVRGAMQRFVNYWGGAGSWDQLSEMAQRDLMRWAPKAPLDFRALLDRQTRASRYDELDMQCRIISGDRSPEPVREIAGILCDVMPNCEIKKLAGAGHMAPFTHGAEVAALMAEHIRSHLPRAKSGGERLARAGR